MPIFVCLPGPPHEVRAMLRDVLRAPAITRLLRQRTLLSQRVMRLECGPQLDETLLGRDVRAAREMLTLRALDVNIRATPGEIELVVEVLFPPNALEQYLAFEHFIVRKYPRDVFSLTEQSNEEIAAMLLGTRRLGIVDLVGARSIRELLEQACPSARSLVLPGELGTAPAGAAAVAPGLSLRLSDDAGELAAQACELLGADVGIGIVPAPDPAMLGFAAFDAKGPSLRCASLPGGDAPGTPIAAMHMLRRVLHRSVFGD